MNENNKWSISYSWTQPYTNWNRPITAIDKEVAVIEAIDNIVNSMTAYPDALKLINNK